MKINEKPFNYCVNKFKVCSRCDLRKRLSAFDKQTIKGVIYYKPYCSGCKSKAHRKRKPEIRKAIAERGKIKYQRNRLVLKLRILKALNQVICRLCGFADIRALVFHHTDKKQKFFSISYGITHHYSFEKLLEEAKKCEILCQNCHCIHHCTETIAQ